MSEAGVTGHDTGEAGSFHAGGFAEAVIDLLPNPLMVVDADGRLAAANDAAEAFFQMSRAMLSRHRITELMPFGSPVVSLVQQARERQAAVSEYRVDVGTPRTGVGKLVDLYVGPMAERPGAVLLVMQEQSVAEKLDRQLTHRGAARSVTALAAMLAHEIKNPLSGIRGAAQLLETTVPPHDRVLTRLIRDETDRIVKLVDRMEVFSDERPIERTPVNIHVVLDHVKRLAENGFARHIRFHEDYDPSLPPVFANRDQLIQVFLNLVKNAADAIGPEAADGEITLSTAYRPGVRLSVPGASAKVSLPLEFCVRDNGPGVNPELLPQLFEPFVTTKASGTGLGLALVAKIIGDHGGVVECESNPRRTVFRILLPKWTGEDADQSGA